MTDFPDNLFPEWDPEEPPADPSQYVEGPPAVESLGLGALPSAPGWFEEFEGAERVYDTSELLAALGAAPSGGVPDRLLEHLNPRQREAVETLEGPLLVVAGPGSGKTRVLTHRIAALLATGVAPWQILAVTFTNKAAAEMRDRLAALTNPGVTRAMWVATFHSACVRILRANAEAAGLPRGFSIADTSDAHRVVRDVLRAMGLPAEASDVRAVHSIISRAKNAGRNADILALSTFADERDAAEVMMRYNARLAALGACDFDDLLLRTLTLLERDEAVRTRYQKRFSHVLVDEYQDTNAVQYRITKLLAAGSENLCVVGDLDQSVYAFRGATPEAMAAFTRDFPSAKVVILDQNYRSTRAILQVAQAVIDPNPAVHRASLWTENPEGEPVELIVTSDDREEAAWVTECVQASLAEGRPPEEHAVLVRTNSQTRAFEEAFTRARVPFQVVGALRFYDRAEVRDALSYLRAAVNPSDSIALVRAITTPKRGVGEVTLQGLLGRAELAGVDAVAQLRSELAAETLPARAAKPLSEFLAIYDEVREAAEESPAAALRLVAERGGLRAMLRAMRDGSGLDREENLDELVASAVRFCEGESPTDPEARSLAELSGLEQTVAFLENVALVSAAELAEDEAEPGGRVSLLTAHSSKGKEYDHVFVVGLEEGLFPHGRSTDAAALEEERRLLFVAVSRARKRLRLSRCRSRMMFGKVVENAKSRFIADMPADVVVLPERGERRPAFGGGWQRRVGTPGRVSPGRGDAPRVVPAGGRRAPQPPPGPRLAATEVQPGERVRHTVFGEGEVLEVGKGNITIAFGPTTRVLSLGLAPLEKV